MQVQYVTNEKGQRTGVLLDIEAYQQLISHKLADTELLTEMSRPELEALADSQLAPASQARLNLLLAQHQERELTEAATIELDELLAQVDQLTILKTRARYTLAQMAITR